MKVAETYNIKEDYCSFEVAKLLKEMGVSFELNPYNHKSYLSNGETNYWEDDEDCVNAPTLYMVMKWLREVHGLSIEVVSVNGSHNGPVFWTGCVILILQQKVLFSTGLLSTYEEVCNKAIKYCLENLVKYCLENLV